MAYWVSWILVASQLWPQSLDFAGLYSATGLERFTGKNRRLIMFEKIMSFLANSI